MQGSAQQGGRFMRQSPIRVVCALTVASALLSGCSNPETRKLEHLKKGDDYAKEKKDEFAVVEYASAVELDPKFGEARLKLAETYERLSRNISAPRTPCPTTVTRKSKPHKFCC